MADLATLRIAVDASGALRVIDQFGNATEQAARKATALETAAKRASVAFGGAFVAGLALAAKETAEAQREQAQLAAALRSTAGAAGQTLDSLNDQAASLRALTAATGGQIAETQALLLTFTKIGGDTFPRATLAALDMAQALGGDARGAAVQLGKALNDPILGVTALGRAGVQFSDSQKAVIANFVETNRLAEAQAIILKELETQVGGSAAAYRNTLGGALAAVRESFLELLDLGNGPRMQGFIENINILADGMGIFATQSALAFARSNAAIRRNEVRAGGFVMGMTRGMFGGGIAGGAAADASRYEAEINALETLLAEQRASMYRGIVARTNAVAGSGGRGSATGGGPGLIASPLDYTNAEFAATVGDLIRAVDAERALAQFRTDATARQLQMTGQFAELIGEGEQSVINFGQVIGKLPEQVTETQRVMTEQLQLAAGRFARGVLDDGLTSLPRLWDGFIDLGKDAISQVFAREFMDRIGNALATRLSDAFKGTGVGGGIFAGLATGFLGAIANLGKAAEAIRETNRAIAAFGRRPEDAQLTDEQRQLRAAEDERDALARRALGDRGFSGAWEGDIAGTRARLLNQIDILNGPLNNLNGPIVQRYRDAIAQLDAIGEAFAANTEAIRANIEALEAQRRAEQRAALQRFSDSMSLGSQSPLSPVAQLAEARRQYDAIVGLARGGDASAIASLPETARTLLDASRAVFASGTRYAEEFARVQADTQALIGALGADPQQPVVDGLALTRDVLIAGTDQLLAVGSAQITVQQDGFTAVATEIAAMRAELNDSLQRINLTLQES